MTPFKFGKKKNKDIGDAFSSPSSKQNQNGNSNKSNSPQTSNYSNSSVNNRARDTVNQVLGQSSTPTSQPQGSQVSLNSPQYQQQYSSQNQQHAPQYGGQPHLKYTAQQGTAIGYDQNNNMYNQKSPQRQQQATHQYAHSPQQANVPPPRFQQPQPQLQGGTLTKLTTPWARSKLLISPFPRYRHAASQFANDKGEIFVMGGLHNTSVYGDTWIIKPNDNGEGFQTAQVDIYDNSPAPRVGHAATTCGNAFLVFGGDTVTNEEGEIDNDLYLFNMNSHTWTIPHPVGRKPSGRYGHTIGVIAITNFDSKVYLYGGQLDDTVYSDLAVFNLSSFRRPDVAWEWVTPADTVRPPPLTNHTMDVYDNKLWIFGGSNGKSLSNDLWSYDPLSNKWDKHKTFGNIPLGCEEHSSVVYKDCLVVYGGKDSYGEAIAGVYFLNLITKTWFKLPENFPGHPSGKYGHSISILKGDKLLILGGHLPDFAQLGDNLEPSVDDNGVGTLLNTLDLSGLEKIIPGFQQYRTPGNLRDQERFQGPQSIFTPPQAQQQSPQKEPPAISPDQYPTTSNADTSSGSSTAITTGGPSNSATAAAAAAVAATGGVAYAGLQKSTSNTYNDRVMSAEDVFQRDREVERQTPQKLPQRQQSITSQTPSRGRAQEQNTYTSVDEEDLPLQLPSPVRSGNVPVPAPLPKDDINATPSAGPEVPDRAIPRRTVSLKRNKVVEMPGAFQPESERDLEDDFQTPYTSPSKESTTATLAAPNQPYGGNIKRESDFLDNYVNGNSTPELTDQSDTRLPDVNDSLSIPNNAEVSDLERSVDISEEKSVFGSGAAVLGAGVTAVGAAAAGVVGLNSVKKTPSPPLQNNEIRSPVGSTGVARSVSINRNVGGGLGSSEKSEFQSIIRDLSRELESLKLSTNEQMKSASYKVQSLESENDDLKRKLAEVSVSTKELPPKDDESEIKRKHIKLNTDYHLLNQEHQTIKSKHAEMESVFNSSLFDLQKLNNVIKEQRVKLDEQQKKLQETQVLKQQYQELQHKYDALSKEHESVRELGQKSFLESHEEVKKLNTGLDSFLAQYLTTDQTTGEVKTRSLGGVSLNGIDDGVTMQLRTQIDELLKENEDAHSQKKELETELESYKSTTSEVKTLKAKIAELSKIEENYKESLHSVNTATRALQLSQSELVREKEVTSKLQREIDELKLFRSKKSSRNATPIISQHDDKGFASAAGQDDEDEEDVANAHYNLRIRDLQAELYIIKRERDDLKEEALALKKKLYNADNPSSSF